MKTAVIINSEGMGNGDEALGMTLVGAFLKKMWARNEKPDTMIFYNGGVKLLKKESGLLDVLSGLDEAGTELIACGTCLEFYKMKDNLSVGRVSSMEEIVNIMMTYDKVITI